MTITPLSIGSEDSIPTADLNPSLLLTESGEGLLTEAGSPLLFETRVSCTPVKSQDSFGQAIVKSPIARPTAISDETEIGATGITQRLRPDKVSRDGVVDSSLYLLDIEHPFLYPASIQSESGFAVPGLSLKITGFTNSEESIPGCQANLRAVTASINAEYSAPTPLFTHSLTS